MAPSLAWTTTGTCLTELTGLTGPTGPTGSRAAHAAFCAGRPLDIVASTPTEPELGQLSEAALVEACLAGRSEAFDLVVERHRRSVYRLCRRFVATHEDASDLSQDIFLRAYRGLRSFRGQSSLATWLYRIGVNVCLNRVSAKAPLEKMTEAIGDRQYIDTRSQSPSERLLEEERGARVRAAIAALPRTQRATLILRMYHEMSHQEIADVLGSSVGTVKANFFHALGNLKKQLGGGEF
jgi:RNA polymerase sigma-70 factor (ECF subfamily)